MTGLPRWFRRLALGCTAFIVAQLALSGVALLVRPAAVLAALHHLGYPEYFAPMLGVAKLLGAAALTYPRVALFTEWAYAGVAFELLAAVVSHAAVGDAIAVQLEPLVVLAMLAASYVGVHRTRAARTAMTPRPTEEAPWTCTTSGSRRQTSAVSSASTSR